MPEIKITISAPELSRTINNLASAMNGSKFIEKDTKASQNIDPQKYSKEQIMQAGAALMDAGKINELTKLLQSFGVQAVTQLKPEQLDEFAAAMRELGANITAKKHFKKIQLAEYTQASKN